MRFANILTFETLAISLVTFSPEMGARAGYPAEQFKELNNKNQRNLGSGDKKSPKNVFDGHKSGESSEKGFMPFAADGEVTLIVRTTSKEGEEKASEKGRNGKAEIYMNELQLLAINVPEKDVGVTIDELSKHSGIDSVEIDQEVHILPAFREKNNDAATSPKGLRSRTRKLEETIPYGISMVKAENVITKGQGMDTTPRKICVVDTGYALGHQDLPSNPDHGVTGFSPYGDDELWNVDGHSHGTHCAGTIGAVNNDIGVVGVNPDPTKFSFHIGKGLTNSGSGSNAGVMSAVNSCVSAGADVISMSLGGGAHSLANADAYKTIYEERGILIIAAAGNSGNAALSYPASYPHVMSVAAVDSNENRPSFSQYNSQVEIAGPGVAVQSTVPNGYGSKTGTSMATPHVAGVAALVWSYFPTCTNHQIRGALIKSARDKGASGCDFQYGHGIVDAEAAFDLLKNNGCDAGDSRSGPSPGGCAQAAGPTPAPTPCTGKTLTLDLATDNFGQETSWDIRDSANNILRSGSGYNDATEYTENWCKNIPGCATFTIHDSIGDGICCGYGSGSYSLTYDGAVIKNGGEFASSESTDFGCTSQTPVPTPNPTPSPTPPPTPSPTSLPPVSSPTLPPVQCDGSELTVKVLTDDYGSETTWIVKDVSNKDSEVLVSGGPYASNTEYTHEECIPTGCVTFTMIDSYGDGLCCGHGAGSYEVMVDGVVINSGGQFGYTESTSIDCPAPTPLPTPPPTDAPTTSPPTPSPTPVPTPAGCHASCATDATPWVAAPGMDSKCSRSTCSSCAECVALTCVQGCYELDAGATGKCSWVDCAGCTDCVDA